MTLDMARISQDGAWLAQGCAHTGVPHENVTVWFGADHNGGDPIWHLALEVEGCCGRTVGYESFESAAMSVAAAGYELEGTLGITSTYDNPVRAHFIRTATEAGARG